MASASCRRGGQKGKSPKADHSSSSLDSKSPSPEAISWNNNAVALMGRYQYPEASAVFSQLVEKFPDWLDGRVNLAIAYLNEDQGGKRALPLLQDVLKTDPDHPRANYCTGVLLRERGLLDEALPYLLKVHEFDDQDPFVAYLIGECIENQSEAEAIEWYKTAVRLDPYFRTPYYRLFDLKRLAGAPDYLEYREKFQQLSDSLLSTTFKVNYAQMGSKATCITVATPAESSSVPVGPPFQQGKPLLEDEPDLQLPAQSSSVSITACDIDGDQRIDLFIAGVAKAETALKNAVLRQVEIGKFQLDMDHPLADVPAVNAAVWGDFDNDQLTDVYLCRTGENQLWRQVEQGRWEDVTQATNTAAGASNTIDAAAYDADHDGDLDLFLVNANGPNELLNNNRDGTFRSIAAEAGVGGDRPSRSLLILDIDSDRDLDLVVINASPPHDVFLNDLAWNYRRGELGDFEQADVSAALAADMDLDGRSEIYGIVDSALVCWSWQNAESWERTEILKGTSGRRGESQLALADVDGDGRLDFLLGGDSWQAFQQQNTGTPIYTSESAELAGWSTAQLDLDGPAVVGIERSGRPVVWKPGSGRHPFVGLTLNGSTKGGSRARSNASGLGARTELRVGSHWTVADHLRSHSGPGQSLQPLALGLGSHSAADFLRVVWPDGVSQVVLNVLPGMHRVVEEDLLPTSCPVLFVWNGEKFEFISDVLSVGGLGYFVAPGVYATSDPSESFLIPENRIALRDGHYELKLSEPMEELTYLDHIGLTTYDLPPGWQMTLDERMGVGDPRPTGQPIYYRRLVVPARARNDRGVNVTDQLQSVGDLAAPPGELDERFVGRLAREHILTLQFDEPIRSSDSAHPVLIADGWVEFPFSQTLFAAWQSEVSFEAPTVEYRGLDGRWHVLLREFGYPAGMPRQMSVSLAGVPAGVTTLRLRTNLEIYWDRIAVADAEPCPDVQTHVLTLRRGELREWGLIPRIVLHQQRPHFEYEQRLPYGITRDPSGFYTPFGDVSQLVAEKDSQLAIFGPGEEVHLVFEAPQPKVRQGWTRRVVLNMHGWCKDMDLYTGQGQTVEPLPGTLQRMDDGRFQFGWSR